MDKSPAIKRSEMTSLIEFSKVTEASIFMGCSLRAIYTGISVSKSARRQSSYAI